LPNPQRQSRLGKNLDFLKSNKRFSYLNVIFLFKSDFYFVFQKFVFLQQGFTKFLKLLRLLSHINNMAAMILLFPVTLLLSTK